MILRTKDLIIDLRLPETKPEHTLMIKNYMGADMFLDSKIRIINDDLFITEISVSDLLLTPKQVLENFENKIKEDEVYKVLVEDIEEMFNIILKLHALCCVMSPLSISGEIHNVLSELKDTPHK